MIILKEILFCILGWILLVTSVYAKNIEDYAFMTASDIQSNRTSNITISNRTGRLTTAYGLFIASFDINDCSSCFGSVVSGDNLGGAVVSPITFQVNQTLPIGQNYLYNMIYNGIYYIKNTVGSSPCSLPGCSWPGDDPSVRGWCVSINVISPNSSYTYSHYTNGSNPYSNIPAYSAAGNSEPFDYKYDLINPLTLGAGGACLGLITCSDKTLTCKVSSSQNAVFEPYV